MLIKNYQEESMLKEDAQAANVATVAAVFADGITLKMPGDTVAAEKHYPFNSACSFAAGQRVHLCREGGTIIVEYPIGGGKAL